MFIVGIDIAKRFHEASVIAQDGSLVRKALRFANSQAGYNKLMNMVRGLNEPVVFGMEATGHYWLTLFTHLRNDGFTVHVINPIQSDALRGMYIRKTKNDAIDSMIIADVIRFGRYCETSVQPGDLQAMRELCRQRFYVIDMASDLKRKVLALLDQVFPEYEKLFSDTFGASSMELLSQYTTPEEMLSVSTLPSFLRPPAVDVSAWPRRRKFKRQRRIPLALFLLPAALRSSSGSISNKSVLWNPRSLSLIRKSRVCSRDLTRSSPPLRALGPPWPPSFFQKSAVISSASLLPQSWLPTRALIRL